jgi:hypothetical protein
MVSESVNPGVACDSYKNGEGTRQVIIPFFWFSSIERYFDLKLRQLGCFGLFRRRSCCSITCWKVVLSDKRHPYLYQQHLLSCSHTGNQLLSSHHISSFKLLYVCWSQHSSQDSTLSPQHPHPSQSEPIPLRPIGDNMQTPILDNYSDTEAGESDALLPAVDSRTPHRNIPRAFLPTFTRWKANPMWCAVNSCSYKLIQPNKMTS